MSSHGPGPSRGNLFTDVEGRLATERVDVLVDGGTVRLERIISRGHATPLGDWYDQDCGFTTSATLTPRQGWLW